MNPTEGFIIRYHRRSGIEEIQESSDGHPHYDTPHAFEVYFSGTRRRWVLLYVWIERDAYDDEFKKLHEEFGADFHDGILKWAVRRIDDDVRAGLISQAASWIELKSEDSDLLRDFFGSKICDYKVREGREQFCSASDDPKAIRQGLRALAPTSEPVCQRCPLPDRAYLCSHLSHPKIQSPRFGDRTVTEAKCDLSRAEIGEPSGCNASQNECWERLILPNEDDRPPTYLSLTLSRAFDYFDMAWRLHFSASTPIVVAPSMVSAASLESDCITEQDFIGKMVELANVLDALAIPDSVLGRISDKEREQLRGQSLNRLEKALKQEVDEDRFAQALCGIKAFGLRKNCGTLHRTAAIARASPASKHKPHSGSPSTRERPGERLGINFGRAWLRLCTRSQRQFALSRVNRRAVEEKELL